MKYTYTQDCTPPRNVELRCLLSDLKTETRLIFDGKLYWMADRSMYVYYVPTMWRLA